MRRLFWIKDTGVNEYKDKYEKTLKLRLKSILLYSGVSIVDIIAVFPIVYTLLTSLKNPVDAFSIPPKWIFIPTLKFHAIVWLEKPFLRYLRNSLIIAFGTTGISISIGSLAGYYFARHRSLFSLSILFTFMAIRMFPPTMLLIPFYDMARALHLYDTYIIVILILVAFNQPFTIWLMRGFFMKIPKEIEESAMIDGCSKLGAFLRVTIPNTRPGLVSACLFCFLLAYNEFLFPLVLTGTSKKPLPVAIAEYGAEKIEYWSISAAGAIGIVAPVLLIMILMQKHLVRGLSYGAVKG